MSSRTRRTVVAYAPDGTEISWDTSGGYSVAGLLQYRNGNWAQVQHGHSDNSVRSRTITSYHRSTDAIDFATAPIWEATVPVVREYFGTHQVTIDSTFTPETGWVAQKGSVRASRAALHRFARLGATAVSLRWTRPYTTNDRVADFQMDELLKSMKSRKAGS